MTVVCEVEFLTGVCRAAREPGRRTPDWPPQPDRVFSALVSAWGARGERPEERVALEWLEAQPPPMVHAGGHTVRTAPDVFVPPNDAGRSKTAKKYLQVMPDGRPRQPRHFPVARPDDPLMALAWPVEAEPAVLGALNALASCVGYVGHSASLVRCRFVHGESPALRHPEAPARRRVYRGRLRELETAHRANPVRPAIRPGAPVFSQRPPEPSRPDSWLVLEAVDGGVPDLRAAPLVCRLVRQALMSGYRKAGLADAIPESVSGHTLDGAPTRLPHLAIAPMAFAGFPHADGSVQGFALIPPCGMALERIEGFRSAFEQVAHYRRDMERRVLTLEGAPLGKRVLLAPSAGGAAAKWSLSPNAYLKPSRCWATATPIVLERHLKGKGEAELRALVASACENAGLPRPDPDRIQVGKHSAVVGMPPAQPLVREPQWMRWKVPPSLASRPLAHAVIDFEEEVAGPVLIGAGRFIGLGFCRGLGR